MTTKPPFWLVFACLWFGAGVWRDATDRDLTALVCMAVSLMCIATSAILQRLDEVRADVTVSLEPGATYNLTRRTPDA